MPHVKRIPIMTALGVEHVERQDPRATSEIERRSKRLDEHMAMMAKSHRKYETSKTRLLVLEQDIRDDAAKAAGIPVIDWRGAQQAERMAKILSEDVSGRHELRPWDNPDASKPPSTLSEGTNDGAKRIRTKTAKARGDGHEHVPDSHDSQSSPVAQAFGELSVIHEGVYPSKKTRDEYEAKQKEERNHRSELLSGLVRDAKPMKQAMKEAHDAAEDRKRVRMWEMIQHATSEPYTPPAEEMAALVLLQMRNGHPREVESEAAQGLLQLRYRRPRQIQSTDYELEPEDPRAPDIPLKQPNGEDWTAEQKEEIRSAYRTDVADKLGIDLLTMKGKPKEVKAHEWKAEQERELDRELYTPPDHNRPSNICSVPDFIQSMGVGRTGANHELQIWMTTGKGSGTPEELADSTRRVLQTVGDVPQRGSEATVQRRTGFEGLSAVSLRRLENNGHAPPDANEETTFTPFPQEMLADDSTERRQTTPSLEVNGRRSLSAKHA